MQPNDRKPAAAPTADRVNIEQQQRAIDITPTKPAQGGARCQSWASSPSHTKLSRFPSVTENEMPAEITIRKNRTQVVRLALAEFKGHRLLTTRVWQDPGRGEPLCPTKHGFTINVSRLHQLIDALNALEQRAKARGWLPADTGGER